MKLIKAYLAEGDFRDLAVFSNIQLQFLNPELSLCTVPPQSVQNPRFMVLPFPEIIDVYLGVPLSLKVFMGNTITGTYAPPSIFDNLYNGNFP